MHAIKYFILLILIIGVWTCSDRPEPNLELFSPEAFAFDVGETWEVNATVNVKGFASVDQENNHKIELDYNVSLISPQLDTIKSIFENNILLDSDDNDEIKELPLEAQIDLDSSFAEGKYTLLFIVSDKISKQTKSIEILFSLE